MATTITFAGVTTTPTPRGMIRIPALIKILRSGRVALTCRGKYTDDYAYDNDRKFARGQADALELAADIADSRSGWRAELEGGVLKIACHSFAYYDATEIPA